MAECRKQQVGGAPRTYIAVIGGLHGCGTPEARPLSRIGCNLGSAKAEPKAVAEVVVLDVDVAVAIAMDVAVTVSVDVVLVMAMKAIARRSVLVDCCVVHPTFLTPRPFPPYPTPTQE